MAGPIHQVFHKAPLPGEALRGSGLSTGLDLDDGLSVTVVLRTALFPHCRSRLRNTTPAPVGMFVKLAESLRSSFVELNFRLPTLGQCQRMLAVGARPGEATCPALHSTKRPRVQ